MGIGDLGNTYMGHTQLVMYMKPPCIGQLINIVINESRKRFSAK